MILFREIFLFYVIAYLRVLSFLNPRMHAVLQVFISYFSVPAV